MPRLNLVDGLMLVDLDLHASVEGIGDLVDMVHVERYEGIEIDTLPSGNGHTRRPMPEMSSYPDHFRMNALGQPDSPLDLVDRRFKPHGIAIADPLRLPHRLVKEDFIGVGRLTDFIDPRVLAAVTAIDVRKL